MTASAPAIRDWAVLVLLALALSVCAYHLAASLAFLHPDNAHTFVTAHLDDIRYDELRQEWKPRILSIGAADVIAEYLWKQGVRNAQVHLPLTIGIHSAFWLLLVNAALLWGFRRRAVFLMWGVFAAVVFGYCPGVVNRVYPWDLPALFFFAAFVACYHRRAYRALPVIVLAGLLFKETTAVLCLAPFFLDIPMKRRLRYALVTAALFVIVKVATDVAVGTPVPFFSMTVRPPDGGTSRLAENVRILGRATLAHPVFINAGTLVALAVVSARNPAARMARWVAAAFAVNTLAFAVIDEYRIWLELAPLAAYVLAQRFHPGEYEQAATDSAPQPRTP